MAGKQSLSVRQPTQEGPRVVVPQSRIAEHVRPLARRIARRYDGQELTILGVITGALVFLADLIRHLPMPLRMELVRVSSYPGEATESHGAKLALPSPDALAGRNVLIVDDILDTGQTMAELVAAVSSACPASPRTCVLFRKQRDDPADRLDPDFVGLNVPDLFFVGYGLDFNGLYRNLPDLCVLSGHDGKAGASKGQQQ